MIKLKKFLSDPLGAYESYRNEFSHRYQSIVNENNNLKKQIYNLEKRNRELRSNLDKAKQKNKESEKAIRTMYYHFTGEKMKKGTEWDYLEEITQNKD